MCCTTDQMMLMHMHRHFQKVAPVVIPGPLDIRPGNYPTAPGTLVEHKIIYTLYIHFCAKIVIPYHVIQSFKQICFDRLTVR